MTGNLTGLSNNSTGVANLATLSFNTGGLISDINFQTTSGTALADDQLSYDGNQRPAGANVTWQNGSGANGIAFNSKPKRRFQRQCRQFKPDPICCFRAGQFRRERDPKLLQ